jgi:uncharacterized membrane protein YidH (DUF202 family)
MALIGLGFVAVRLRLESAGSAGAETGWASIPVVGLGFAVIGVSTVVYATWRYQAVRKMIERGEFEALNSGVLVISGAALCVAILVILHLLQQFLR